MEPNQCQLQVHSLAFRCRLVLNEPISRPQGLLKILTRTDSAIRDDGHWYVDPERIDQIAAARQVLGLAGAPTIDQIAAARQVLGLDRNTGATTKETF